MAWQENVPTAVVCAKRASIYDIHIEGEEILGIADMAWEVA